MGSYAGNNYVNDGTPRVAEELREMDSRLKLMPLHANGWLNDMKVSSPTSIRVNIGIGNFGAFDPIYRAWTVSSHPTL